MQMRSSANGKSISKGIMPNVVAFSNDSLTSLTMWMNTVESNTPPPKHNTNPVSTSLGKEHQIKDA